MSDSPGLVDFAIGLVNSVFNLPDEQVMFVEEFEKQKNCEINTAHQLLGLVELTSGLESLPQLCLVVSITTPGLFQFSEHGLE